MVQYFIKHIVSYCDASDEVKKEEHAFAYMYVKWKVYNWYGISATVSIDMFEPPGACTKDRL